jgi:hypothetical protein
MILWPLHTRICVVWLFHYGSDIELWGNYVLGSFLRIWVLLVFDLPIIVWRLCSLFWVSLSGCLYVDFDIQILCCVVVVVVLLTSVV